MRNVNVKCGKSKWFSTFTNFAVITYFNIKDFSYLLFGVRARQKTTDFYLQWKTIDLSTASWDLSQGKKLYAVISYLLYFAMELVTEWVVNSPKTFFCNCRSRLIFAKNKNTGWFFRPINLEKTALKIFTYLCCSHNYQCLNYRTSAIITRGLYTFYPIFEGQTRLFKEFFFRKILTLCTYG